ncbi:hypothetical protein D3C78_1851800 [compost metagenome]
MTSPLAEIGTHMTMRKLSAMIDCWNWNSSSFIASATFSAMPVVSTLVQIDCEIS